MLNDVKLLTYISEFKSGLIESEDLLFNDMFSDDEKNWFADKIKTHLEEQKSLELSIGTYEPEVDIIDRPQEFIRTWGTRNLDTLFPPIEDHHSILLAGKQGDGKTAFTFFLALENAKEMMVEYISLEMSNEDLLNRMGRQAAGINKLEWRDKKTIPDRKRIIYKRRKVELRENKNLRLTGLADSKKTAEGICDHLRLTRPGLAIIDNLGLIDAVGAGNETAQQIIASKIILEFCKSENIPVILIHHLNKAGDIRGSEKLLDNATTVIGLRRAFQDNDDVKGTAADKAKTILNLRKDRDFGDQGLYSEIFFNKGDFADDFEGMQSGFTGEVAVTEDLNF